ncbi:hypothetical protein NCC49_004307 [Naganishia albida]|nr:hypothetical protein NCC49_004307 [Naganishia albida]
MPSPETQTRNLKQAIRPLPNSPRRPSTPFHHNIPPAEEGDQLPSAVISGPVVAAHEPDARQPGPAASDSGTAIHPSNPASGNGQTIFLDVDDAQAPRSQGSVTSGASSHQSSTGEEYSFLDPFVAKVALKTLRKLSPSYRSMDGHAGDVYLHHGCGEDEGEGQHGYGTDSSQRKQQRQVDNATVIPAMSSGSTRKRSQPLHRKVSAGKLRSALRGASTSVQGVANDSPDRFESLQGPEIDVSLSNDAHQQRKPLPPPPPSHDRSDMNALSYGGPNCGYGWQGQNQPSAQETGGSRFSLRSLRPSLPAIGINLPSSKNRPLVGYTEPADPPSSIGWHTSSASPGTNTNSLGRHQQLQRGTTYIQSQHTPPISASVPVLEGLLPSTGKTHRHTPLEPHSDSRKKHPADDLSLYLRLASLPKWDKWIDPDVKTSSRWHNRANWGTGRARRNSKSQVPSNKYESIASNSDLEEGPSGRKRTIERLVYSATHCADHARSQAQERTSPVPSPAALDGVPQEDPSGTPARFLRSWESRRRFLDAVENCEFSVSPLPSGVDLAREPPVHRHTALATVALPFVVAC